jgi:hypothetical protein
MGQQVEKIILKNFELPEAKGQNQLVHDAQGLKVGE